MREKIVYVEGESDKIFLTLLNEFRNLRINGENIVSCKGNTKLFKEAESIKEYLFLIQTTKQKRLKFKR